MIKARCPICDRVMEGQSRSEWPQFPFCSDRCRLIDLGRWLGERYAIAAEPDGEAAEPGAETEIP
ncbi:MAG TPA: DNA gyrase inhibitor YacG [Gemmataceae bacterium]|nr:DNA gyrase inhibitor YacG [Gemmataceae bacterium]